MAVALLVVALALNLRACLDAPAPPTTGEEYHQSFLECLDVVERTGQQLGECRIRLSQITPCPDESEANGS